MHAQTRSGSLLLDKGVAGAAAGLIATVPMTAALVLGHRLLQQREHCPLPPRIITDRLAGDRTPCTAEPFGDVRSVLAHFAFGAATGSVYSALRPNLARRNPVSAGITYALAVWAASYLGWVPASGAMRPATHQPAARNALMIAAHIVWGAVLGKADQVLSKKEKRHEILGPPPHTSP